MDTDNSMSLSAKVIEAIADFEGVSPTELDFSLYDEIDPDVLDRLASQSEATWELAFEVQDYLVQVTSSGTVAIEEDPDENEPQLA